MPRHHRWLGGILGLLASLGASANPTTLSAQDKAPLCTIPSEPKIDTAATDRLTGGCTPRLDSTRKATLLKLREIGQSTTLPLWNVRPIIFGETYTPGIVDWVVYVGKNSIREGFTRNNRDLPHGSTVIRGAKFVNFIILVERPRDEKKPEEPKKPTAAGSPAVPPPKPSTRADSMVMGLLDYVTNPGNKERLSALRDLVVGEEESLTLKVRQDVVQYERDPFITRLIGGFGEALLGKAPTLDHDTPLADSTVEVKLQALGSLDEGTVLFMARGKFPLRDDMWGRLMLDESEDVPLPGAHSVLHNFSAVSRSSLGVSLIGAMILGGTSTSVSADSTGKLTKSTKGTRHPVNFYLTANLRIGQRPRPLDHNLGLRFESLSLLVGTNLIRGDPLDQVLLGASLDGLFGTDIGIAGGVVRLETEKIKNRNGTDRKDTSYRYPAFVGFSLAL